MRFFVLLILTGVASLSNAQLRLEVVAEGIKQPWAIAAISDNKFIVSQREGDLVLLDTSGEQVQKTTIKYLPDDLLTGGQGGLLDVLPHPDYASNNWIYVSYSAGELKNNYLKVQRLTLDVQADLPEVSAVEDIFRVADAKDTPVHYAGRMVFDNDGHILITSGDGFDYREKAQVKSSQLGKVLRMSDSGLALKDNPFYGDGQTPQSYVYSYGHRNSQGLLVHNDGTIVAHEHGAAGGDEVNVIEAGNNYGWPVVTNGVDYIGSTISPFKDYPGMELPVVDWTPSIAPSSMIFYQGDKLSELTNKYLVTSLKFKRVYVLDENFKAQPDLFNDNGRRLRDIETDSNGEVYILSDDADAVVYRITY